MEINQTLVDYLVTAVEEEDVLFTHYWLIELREKGQLPRALEQTHSWKNLTPLEMAASRPASRYSKLNLEMILLSGARISTSAGEKAREAKNAEALLVMGGWMKNRCKLALEARRLLDMSSEAAAEWVDGYLSPHPNAKSFTGYGELPPRPASFPTPPPSTSSSDTTIPRGGSARPLARISTSPVPALELEPLPPSQQLYHFTLSDCPLTLSHITIHYLVGRVSGFDITHRPLDESTEISFLLRGKDLAETAFKELNGLKLQGEAIRAEYVEIAEQRQRKGGKDEPKKIRWEGKQRKRNRSYKREEFDPLERSAVPHIPSINLSPCRSKQRYRSQQLQNDHKEEESQEPETLLFSRSRPSLPLSKKPKLAFNLGSKLQLGKKTSIVLHTGTGAVAAPSEFANGRLETENENLILYEQTPEWPEVREESEKKETSWKGIGGKVEREVKEVVGTKRRIDFAFLTGMDS